MAAKTVPPSQSALNTLTFAERMLTVTRKHRREQLALGRIDQATHDRDVAAAEELKRLAENLFLFGDDAAPLS